MTALQTVWLVARREMSAKMRDKGFLLSTAFILVVIVGSVALQVVLANRTTTYSVGVVGSSSQLSAPLTDQAKQLDAKLTVRSYDDTAAGRAAVTNGDIDALIDDQTIVVEQSLDPELAGILNTAVGSIAAADRLTAAGLDPAQVTQALAAPPLSVSTLEPDAERTSQRQVVAFVGVALLYGLLIFIGQYVAMGVVEEKSSRVVELLLATIRPWQLLAGKVTGLGLLGLAQMLIISVGGLGAAIGFDLLAVPSDAIGTVAQLLFWFILGYTFFSAAFAAAASLVSRQEDLQSVTLPMILVLVVTLFVAIQAGQSPDSLLSRIASIVPPLSPMVMPVRVAGGGVPWWQIGLAVALMLAAIAGIIRLGGRIYAGALLRTGGKVSVKDAMSAAGS